MIIAIIIVLLTFNCIFKSTFLDLFMVGIPCYIHGWIGFMQEYDVEDAALPIQPSLNYTAPELVRNNATSSGSSCDIFSFGCLVYHLIARKPLLDCHNNVKMVKYTIKFFLLLWTKFSFYPLDYFENINRKFITISFLSLISWHKLNCFMFQYTNSMTYLTSETFSAIPPELVVDLRRMLSMDESSRPSALEFTGKCKCIRIHW